MTAGWSFRAARLVRRIWFRATLFSLLAVATAILAMVVSPYIPSGLPARIGADAVESILGIIAASMLTVTTFSLSTVVTAFGSATSNVTPRATSLVIEDSTTQNVLATFLGSFLFSLAGIILLSAGAYGEGGRLVLFVTTIVVVIVITVTLLRWIDHLSHLGRVTDTSSKVEAVAARAMEARHALPWLGGTPFLDPARTCPPAARPIHLDRIGYVQHVDIRALDALAEKAGAQIFVRALPGEFAVPGAPIAGVDGDGDEDQEDQASAIRACFTIGESRSFEQDPRFGVCVLTEIASRALSASLNDSGTAIDIIGRGLRLLSIWARPDAGRQAPRYPRVHVPPILLEDVFDDFFMPIARDGAGRVEIGLRMQKALRTLAGIGDIRYAQNAVRHSRLALARAEEVLHFDDDRRQLRAVATEVEAIAAARLPTLAGGYSV